MRHALIDEAALAGWLARLVETGRVMAPVRRGRVSFDFEWIDDPRDVALEYIRTVLPPKKAIMPAREPLLEFSRRGGLGAREQSASPVIDERPYVLFGVHPCDLAAIGMLDWSMGRRDARPDPHYLARRSAATIVGIECMPDRYCFCTSVGTCNTRAGADLFLTPVDGRYVAEVLTRRGERLLRKAPKLLRSTAGEAAKAAAWGHEKAERTTLRLAAQAPELADLIDSRWESDIFDQTAERCYSCGTCTNVCPTCFCFDVFDELDITLAAGTRARRYDSCQFEDFAVVAGPHNFRGERADRVRHRWFRKFVYLLREYGQAFCVGCGRCSHACTAKISLVDVINAVVAEARGSVTG